MREGAKALAGAVSELPVAQVAPPAERDRARADAAQRHCYTILVRLVVRLQHRPIRVELCFAHVDPSYMECGSEATALEVIRSLKSLQPPKHFQSGSYGCRTP